MSTLAYLELVTLTWKGSAVLGQSILFIISLQTQVIEVNQVI